MVLLLLMHGILLFQFNLTEETMSANILDLENRIKQLREEIKKQSILFLEAVDQIKALRITKKNIMASHNSYNGALQAFSVMLDKAIKDKEIEDKKAAE